MISSVHAWAVVETKMNVVPCCGFQIIAEAGCEESYFERGIQFCCHIG